MSSIRPLVTITVLAVVGAYLYVKINEGAVHPAPDAASATAESAAPPWPATTVEPAPLASSGDIATEPETTAPAVADAAAIAPPAVPAIPEMPEIGATTQADPPAAPPATTAPAVATTPEAPAPAAPAVAAAVATPGDRYATQPAVTEPLAPAVAAPPAVATPFDAAASTPPIAEAPAPTATPAQEAVTTPEEMNAAAAAGLQSAPLTSQPNPLRPTTPPATSDRYGATEPTTLPAEVSATTPAAATPEATVPPAAATASNQSFSASWPGIQAALDRGELAEAHKQLTRWYGDPSLTPTDADRVDTLLSQLAGTVVYSTEHRLAPAHVVKQGETLDSIAQQYNVPAPLLAKINGIAPEQIQPGQELKVVRGPFEAVVDLGRSQITLMVDGRYAGKFPVTLSPGQAVADGEWVVGQKSNPTAPGRALLLQGNAAAPGAPAPSLVIASETLPLDGASASVIKVAAQDAEELTDILSVGSRVVTRR